MSYNSFSQHASPSFSSNPPSSSPQIKSDGSATSSFAFLVHSQDTLPNNLPPDVDNKGLARQRRRRTSPEDQAILEAEFQKNDRPNREARQAIVEQVALGEKEVQIWFQNRRQLAKRRSRPLLPHELWPPYLNQHSAGQAMPSSSAERNEAALAFERANASLASKTVSTGDSSPDASGVLDDQKDDVGPTLRESDVDSPSELASSPLRPSPESPRLASYTPVERVEDQTKDIQPSTVPVKSSSPIIAASSPGEADPIKRPKSTSAVHDRRKERLRISMSSAGVAKILRDDESSPSPPRPQSVDLLNDPTFRSIRQSYSSKDLPEPSDVPDPLGSSLNSNTSRRLNFSPLQPVGRSRDSRAWEFWCDPEAQQSLAKQADEEFQGSAQNSLRFMREASRASVLSTSSSRGNMQLGEDRPSLKRSKSGVLLEQPKAKRRSLSRSQTSTGRLQRARDSGIGMEVYVDEDCNDPKRTDSTRLENEDSDKENIDPDLRPQPPRRGTQTTRRPPILGQSSTAPSSRQPKYRGPQALQTLVNVGNTHSWRRPRPARDRSTGTEHDPEDDPEIAKFMGSSKRGGGRVGAEKKSQRSEADDMDCVQGLLSLSQGAWK